MKRLFFGLILFCVLTGCAKQESSPTNPNAKISNEIQTLIAGKVIAVLYLRSTDETIGEFQFDYPNLAFTDIFLIIDGTVYIDQITQFSLGETGTEYYLDIVTSPE